MADDHPSDRRPSRPDDQQGGLPGVKAAQARAVAGRWSLGKLALGTVFLVGAMSYALGPERQSRQSVWASGLLLLLSTVYVGLALHGFSRVRQRGKRLWVVLTVAWAVLAGAIMKIVGLGG